jgi:D-beta-D-heptose 7-phosphate kinase/D-beta-D-heptose 1-phosphate adenosyltransferase
MLVFTNGCFDILHVGHLSYLEQSRALGKYLVVGLNSDASVRRLKGGTRPINGQEDRKRMLLALRCVDAVYIFDEDTPLGLIKRVKPDIITKGGDYRAEDVVGHGLAKVVILPYVEGKSTTGVIDACRGQGLGLREDLGRRADVLWKGIGL